MRSSSRASRPGAREVTIGNRTAGSATALVRRFAGVGRGARSRRSPSTIRRSPPRSGRRTWRSTRRPSACSIPGSTIDVELLPPEATVFDLVYVPAETPLLAAARARGLRAANGSEMLIAQAAIAFERWTGVGGMADVMRAAVAPLLADARPA